MNALAAIMTLLLDIENVRAPVTNTTGGTSKGDPDAGGQSNPFPAPRAITAADRAGAGILTFLVLALTVGMFGWMTSGFGEGRPIVINGGGRGKVGGVLKKILGRG